MCSKPACSAARNVSARASSSKDAGTVSKTSCCPRCEAPSFACCASHAVRMYCKYCAEASTGESFGTSSGACHGKIGEVLFTAAHDSHDFAEATSREGFSAPRLRANSPMTNLGARSHGNSRLPTGKSNSPGAKRKDGSKVRSATSLGLASCGIFAVTISPLSSEAVLNETAEFVVPRSMPITNCESNQSSIDICEAVSELLKSVPTKPRSPPVPQPLVRTLAATKASSHQSHASPGGATSP